MQCFNSLHGMELRYLYRNISCTRRVIIFWWGKKVVGGHKLHDYLIRSDF